MMLLLAISLFVLPSGADGPEDEQLRLAIEQVGAMTPEQVAARVAENNNWFFETYPLLKLKPLTADSAERQAPREFRQAIENLKSIIYRPERYQFESNVPLAQQRRIGNLAVFDRIQVVAHVMSAQEAAEFKAFYEKAGLDFRRFDDAIDHWARHRAEPIRFPRDGVRAHLGEWCEAAEPLHRKRYDALRGFEREVLFLGSERVPEAARQLIGGGGSDSADRAHWLMRFEAEVPAIRSQFQNDLGPNLDQEVFLSRAQTVRSTNRFFEKSALAPFALTLARDLAKRRTVPEDWRGLFSYLSLPSEVLPVFPDSKRAQPFLVEALVQDDVDPQIIRALLESKDPHNLEPLVEMIDTEVRLNAFAANVKMRLGRIATRSLDEAIARKRRSFYPRNRDLFRMAIQKFCGSFLK